MEALKLVGAGMILSASGWVGVHSAIGLRRSHEQLRQLRGALALLAGEVDYAGTPFRSLCEAAARESRGAVRRFFRILGEVGAEMGQGVTARAAAEAELWLPTEGQRILESLFDGFGLRDRESQLRALSLAEEGLARLEREQRIGLETRCRSAVMLGLCAGAALLVLVI